MAKVLDRRELVNQKPIDRDTWFNELLAVMNWLLGAIKGDAARRPPLLDLLYIQHVLADRVPETSGVPQEYELVDLDSVKRLLGLVDSMRRNVEAVELLALSIVNYIKGRQKSDPRSPLYRAARQHYENYWRAIRTIRETLDAIPPLDDGEYRKWLGETVDDRPGIDPPEESAEVLEWRELAQAVRDLVQAADPHYLRRLRTQIAAERLGHKSGRVTPAQDDKITARVRVDRVVLKAVDRLNDYAEQYGLDYTLRPGDPRYPSEPIERQRKPGHPASGFFASEFEPFIDYLCQPKRMHLAVCEFSDCGRIYIRGPHDRLGRYCDKSCRRDAAAERLRKGQNPRTRGEAAGPV